MSEFNEKPKKKFYKRWWFWLIVAVVVIGVGGAAGSGGDDPADTKTAQTEQTEEATEATEATEALTTGQRNALGSAESYLSTMPFSYSGLIEQLEYEGYSTEDATYAADNCGAD